MTTDPSATAALIDFEAYYTVKGRGGVAWYLTGWDKTWTEPEAELVCDVVDPDHDHDDWCYLMPESEQVDCHDRVTAVMVGDDTPWLIDVEDLVKIDREDFCGQCGQVGCTHDGLERDE